MMRKAIAMMFVVFFILSLTTLALAKDAGSGTKLERGLRNIGLGWTEIPKNIVDTSKSRNAFWGITAGTAKGVCEFFARTVSGIVDVATFPFGTYDKPVIKPSMVPEEAKK